MEQRIWRQWQDRLRACRRSCHCRHIRCSILWRLQRCSSGRI